MSTTFGLVFKNNKLLETFNDIDLNDNYIEIKGMIIRGNGGHILILDLISLYLPNDFIIYDLDNNIGKPIKIKELINEYKKQNKKI